MDDVKSLVTSALNIIVGVLVAFIGAGIGFFVVVLIVLSVGRGLIGVVVDAVKGLLEVGAKAVKDTGAVADTLLSDISKAAHK